MVNNIYSEKVFDSQQNGTVFYRQGQVMDLPKAGPGIYESWRYNFDAGKAVFRADKTNKVFEKRLVKDSFGVPRWTAWMEISNAETRGVQAIGINDGVLRLPNEDGAIKLEITAAQMNAYSRTETDRLIDQKITEFEDSKYTYIPWALEPTSSTPKNWTPIQVLEDAFPSGGECQHLYIVAAKPAVAPAPSPYPRVTQFIWDVVGKAAGGKLIYGWIDTGAAGSLEAFVTYGTFDAHRLDVDRDFPDVRHVNPSEKARIAQAVQMIDYVAHLKGETKDPNIDDFNLHVTATEKEYWNSKLNNTPLGFKNKRYVAYTPDGTMTEWQQALEQVNYGMPLTDIYRPWGMGLHQFTQEDFGFPKTYGVDIAKLLEKGSVPLELTISFATLDTKGSEVFFEFNNDPKYRSPVWNTAKPAQPPFSYTTPVILGHDDEGKPIYVNTIRYCVTKPAQVYTSIGDLSFTLSWQNPNQVEFGLSLDYDINLIGKALKLNGKDLNIDNTASERALWGKISGDIYSQTDLTQLLNNRDYERMPLGPAVKDVRYDVIDRNKYIASLVQHTARTNSDVLLAVHDPVTCVAGNNSLVKGGYSALFAAAYADPAKLRDMEVTNVKIRSKKGIVMPPHQPNIWFYVDNPLIPKSQVFDRTNTGTIFEWDLGPFTDWDTIYVGNPPSDPSKNAFVHINELEIIVEGIAFSGVEAGRIDKTFLILASERPQMTFDEGGARVLYHIADKESLDAEIARAKAREDQIEKDLTDKIDEVDERLDKKIDDEIERAIEAEDQLAEAIASEEARAKAREDEIEETINKRVDDEIEKLDADIADLDDRLEAEIARAKEREDEIEADLTDKIENEMARATAAEEELDAKIDEEIDRAKKAEDELAEAIAKEEERAKAREDDLQDQIENEMARATAAEEDLDEKIEKEIKDRKDEMSAFKSETATNLGTKIDKDFADASTSMVVTDFNVTHATDKLNLNASFADPRTKARADYSFGIITDPSLHITTTAVAGRDVAKLDIDHDLQVIRKIRTVQIQSLKGADLIRYEENDPTLENDDVFYVGAPQYHTIFRAPKFRIHGVDYENLVAEIAGKMFLLATMTDIEKWDETVVHKSGAEDIGGVKTFHSEVRVKKLSSFNEKGISERYDLIQYNNASDKIEVGDKAKILAIFSRQEDPNYFASDHISYIPDHVRARIENVDHWLANYDDVTFVDKKLTKMIVDVDAKLDAEISRSINRDDELDAAIKAEEARAKLSELTLDKKIGFWNAALQAEVVRATAEERKLLDLITKEALRAISVEKRLEEWHDIERAERIAADNVLHGKKVDKDFATRTSGYVIGDIVMAEVMKNHVEIKKTAVSPVTKDFAEYIIPIKTTGGLELIADVMPGTPNYIRSLTIHGTNDELEAKKIDKDAIQVSGNGRRQVVTALDITGVAEDNIEISMYSSDVHTKVHEVETMNIGIQGELIAKVAGGKVVISAENIVADINALVVDGGCWD